MDFAELANHARALEVAIPFSALGGKVTHYEGRLAVAVQRIIQHSRDNFTHHNHDSGWGGANEPQVVILKEHAQEP